MFKKLKAKAPPEFDVISFGFVCLVLAAIDFSQGFIGTGLFMTGIGAWFLFLWRYKRGGRLMKGPMRRIIVMEKLSTLLLAKAISYRERRGTFDDMRQARHNSLAMIISERLCCTNAAHCDVDEQLVVRRPDE